MSEIIVKPLTLREEFVLLKNELSQLKSDYYTLNNRVYNSENKLINLSSQVTREINNTNNSISRVIDYLFQSDTALYKVIDFSNYLMERFGTDLVDMEIAQKCKIDTTSNGRPFYVGMIPRPNSYISFNI